MTPAHLHTAMLCVGAAWLAVCVVHKSTWGAAITGAGLANVLRQVIGDVIREAMK